MASNMYAIWVIVPWGECSTQPQVPQLLYHTPVGGGTNPLVPAKAVSITALQWLSSPVGLFLLPVLLVWVSHFLREPDAHSWLHSISLHVSAEDPHPWTLCLLGRCDAAVQITSQPPALQNASRGWAARSWSTLSALSEMSIICFIRLPELQWTSLPVWPVAQVLQHVKKPPLSWELLWHIFSDERQASLNTKLKECQMGWVIFIPLLNPCFWTAGARPLKSWSWHNPGICF